MMTFDDDPHARGWRSIYIGLYSPFQNKYTAFMKQAIERAKENSPVKQAGLLINEDTGGDYNASKYKERVTPFNRSPVNTQKYR